MKRWLLPGIMATLATALLFALLASGTSTIVASTSVASTAFVLFAAPASLAARPWNTLMGHLLGLGAGLLVLPLAGLGVPPAIPYSISVGASVALMQWARASHPPAAGTALTVPAAHYHGGFTSTMAIVLLLTVAGLLLVQRPVRKYLPAEE